MLQYDVKWLFSYEKREVNLNFRQKNKRKHKKLYIAKVNKTKTIITQETINEEKN